MKGERSGRDGVISQHHLNEARPPLHKANPRYASIESKQTNADHGHPISPGPLESTSTDASLDHRIISSKLNSQKQKRLKQTLFKFSLRLGENKIYILESVKKQDFALI